MVLMDFQRCITEGRKPEQRGGHTSFLYAGRLLVWGGTRYEKGISAQIDPLVITSQDSVFSYFNNLFALDMETFLWKEISTGGVIIPPRYGHSATLVGSRLFLFGGRGAERALYKDVHVLDLKTWTWAPVASQSNGPPPRMNHACVLVGRKIVTHGGWDGKTHAFDDLWVFDTETFIWMKPHIGGLAPCSRHGHTLTLLDDGRILCLGGAGLKQDLGNMVPEYYNDMRELDTETMIWSRSRTVGHQFPSARAGHTASLVGKDQLIIFGGWGFGGMQTEESNKRKGASSTFIYNILTSTWSCPKWVKQSLMHKYGHSVNVSETGALVVMGGWDGKQATNDVVIAQVLATTPIGGS